jgi:tRNA dimethylallyltransferase
MNGETLPLLVAILGSTASGKSALALHLAKHLDGEILACDSTQLYRGFDIGTGKPTPAERASVPHHLLDVLDPGEEASAGGYRELALEALTDLRQREKLPIFTVGTGLYLRALLEGLAELPQRSEEVRARLRASMEKHGAGHLHKLLERIDPASAERIAAADVQKLIRAVEVCVLTQRPLTEVHQQGRAKLEGWQIVKIGLEPPRAELYDRIHGRIDAMLGAGWQREAAQLLEESGASSAACKPLDFLGYRELVAVDRRELALDEARAAIQQATRHYAKRQQTWFRREKDVLWFRAFGDDAETQQQILARLRALREGSAAASLPK